MLWDVSTSITVFFYPNPVQLHPKQPQSLSRSFHQQPESTINSVLGTSVSYLHGRFHRNATINSNNFLVVECFGNHPITRVREINETFYSSGNARKTAGSEGLLIPHQPNQIL